MPDVPIVNRATTTAPKNYTLPQSQEILLKAVSADIDGTGAAGTFLPALQMVSNNGDVMWTAIDSSQTIAAGGSASVTWFPGVKGAGFTPTPGTGVPPAGNLDGWVFRKTNLTVTAVGHADSSNVLLQGNTITLDGLTSILVEVYVPCIEINSGALNQACGIELYDGSTDKGTMAYTVGNINGQTAQLLNGGIHAIVPLTPAAGTHTYKVCAWRNINSDTVIVFANTFVDGTGNFGPAAYRITVIPYDASLPA